MARRDSLSMIRDTLLVAGLLLTTSTQLRIPNAPIGPGEACLAMWLLIALSRFLFRLDVPLPPAFFRFLVFWVPWVSALCIGTMTAYVTGATHDAGLFYHDIIAYVLVSGIIFFCIVESQAEERLQDVCWLLIVLGSLFLALQFVHAWTRFEFLEIDPWFWHRFRGWSENSNTLALTCLILALLSIHLVETSTRFSGKLVALTCGILPVVAGILTDSDAFTFALAASVTIFFALKFWNSQRSKTEKLSFSSLSALAAMLVLPVFLATASPIAWTLASRTQDNNAIARSLKYSALKDDAQDRFQLWNQALARAINSGMLGLGPGPHLDMPRRHQKPSKEPNMDLASPPPSFEAHNTFLDLLVQGGILAVMSIIWLGTIAAITVLKAGKHALAALVFGLAVFALTHLVIRIPVVWFVLAFSLVVRPQDRRPPQTMTMSGPRARSW